MNKVSRRQHYIPRFYLRNFANPIFSDNLQVFNIKKKCWDTRTPNGVGWYPHICSMIDIDGKRNDEFDKLLKEKIEDPAAPAIKKLANRKDINEIERSAVASFIALIASRSPEMMQSVLNVYLNNISNVKREELDKWVNDWCRWHGKPFDSSSYNEFLKPSSFEGIWIWSQNLKLRLMQWEWHFVETTFERPFITSDYPVFAQWNRKQDVRLLSFPISSEIALIIITGGQFNLDRDHSNEAYAINRQTMDRATEFIVSCNKDYPGKDYVLKLTNR